MTREEAAQLADESLHAFLEAMAGAGNPGSGRHEIGMHHVRGWILEYDPAIGGSEIQAVIGLDGSVHALREPRSLRTRKLTGAQYALEHGAVRDPVAGALRFAERLSQIRDFDRGERKGPGAQAWDTTPPAVG